MKILGIDTSCDDTSAAVVVDGERVLSSVIHSQVELHHPYGGVVPELASREHLRNIVPVVDRALSMAHVELTDLDGIAVTVGGNILMSTRTLPSSIQFELSRGDFAKALAPGIILLFLAAITAALAHRVGREEAA